MDRLFALDLCRLIYLHTQRSGVFRNRAVVDTSVVGVADDATFSSVAICKSEAHLNMFGRFSTGIHEMGTFLHVLDEHCLLDRLIDNKLISNKVFFDLCIGQLDIFTPFAQKTVLTVRALIHVTSSSGGSLPVVSMCAFLPMYIGADLDLLASSTK